jgi:hypothetical protein
VEILSIMDTQRARSGKVAHPLSTNSESLQRHEQWRLGAERVRIGPWRVHM